MYVMCFCGWSKWLPNFYIIFICGVCVDVVDVLYEVEMNIEKILENFYLLLVVVF